MDCSLPGCPVHGISQARIWSGVAISFCRGSSWLRDWSCISCRWLLFYCSVQSLVSSSLQPHGLQPSQASLSITNSQSLLKLMSIESVRPSNHLILCHPLLLQPSIFPSMRVFSNLSILRIRWPKYWSFSFNISPSNEYSGLISFRMNWLDLLAFQRTLNSLLQHHSSKASILWHSAFFTVQLSHPHLTFTGIKQSKMAWQGRLYFCRRVCYRQRSGSSIFIPEKQVPCPGSSQIEDHWVTIFPGCCLSLYWMIDNYFPHPFSSLCMSRIKPRNVAHQNVLMRKENEEVKRTKDWQLATILEILFASQLYTFLFNYSKNESLLYFL